MLYQDFILFERETEDDDDDDHVRSYAVMSVSKAREIQQGMTHSLDYGNLLREQTDGILDNTVHRYDTYVQARYHQSIS